MAKANLTLPNGTKVTLEGTAEEVATLLARFSQPAQAQQLKTKHKRKSKATEKQSSRKRRVGPTQLISELIDENFFKSGKTLNDIQKKLEERGHIYAQTSLSPVLTHLARKRTLRRSRVKKKGWVYFT